MDLINKIEVEGTDKNKRAIKILVCIDLKETIAMNWAMFKVCFGKNKKEYSYSYKKLYGVINNYHEFD